MVCLLDNQQVCLLTQSVDAVSGFGGSVRHTTHQECVDETQVLTTSQKYLHLSGVLLNQAIRQLQLVGMSGSLPGSMALLVR